MQKPLAVESDEFGVPVHIIGRNQREQTRISINEFKGNTYIDLRIFYKSDEGYRPTKRGLTLKTELFPELFRGIVEFGNALGFDEQSLSDALEEDHSL